MNDTVRPRRSWFSNLSRSRLPTGIVGLSIFVLLGLIPGAMAVYIATTDGTLTLPGADKGLLEDVIYCSYFVAWPLFAVLVLQLGRAAERSHASALELVPNEHHPTLSRDSWATAAARVYVLLLVLATSFGFFYNSTINHLQPIDVYGFDIWSSPTYPRGLWFRFVHELVLYLGVAPLCAYRIVWSWQLLTRFGRVIYRESPSAYDRFAVDSAGGLSALGSHSLWHVWSTTPAFLIIVTYWLTYPQTRLLVLGSFVYLIVVLAGFMIPLWPTHRAMQDMRDRSLLDLAVGLRNGEEVVLNSLRDADSPHELTSAIDADLKMQELHRSVANLPTWPFSQSVLRQATFIAVVVGVTLLVQVGVIVAQSFE